MTDYSQSFPDGTLLIRDNGAGNQIQFFFYAANQNINYGFIQFEKRVNNVTTVFQFGLGARSGWTLVSYDFALFTQYVTLNLDTNLGIFNHGSADPGYPYSYTVHISRPTAPQAPSRPLCYNPTVNSMSVSWSPPTFNGGATVTAYQLGYGSNSSGPTTILNNVTSPAVIHNLPTGTICYFWVKAGNGYGWSDWSLPGIARTYLGAYIKVSGAWKLAIPYARSSGIWKEVEPIIHRS